MSDSREFLFKAISVETGEWVEGDLIINSWERKRVFIQYFHKVVGTTRVKVHPHTVCQFWRMLKDGVRLFSGDILVTGHSGSLGPNLDTWEEDDFSRTRVIIEKGDFTCSNWDVDWDSDDSIYEPQFCRVVGNIHDTGKEKDVSDVSYAKFVDILVRKFSEATGLTNLPGLREKLLDVLKSTEDMK